MPIDVIAGWQLHATMRLRTPLRWLLRHLEFHEGAAAPTESIPAEHAYWTPITKTWEQLGVVGLPELPESTTMASEVGLIPCDGGEFLPFLLEYRMIVEDGGGDLQDLIDRYPKYRDLVFRPAKRAKRVTKLTISIKNYWRLPDQPGQYHFEFEFCCTECGGYLLNIPDDARQKAKCVACDREFGSVESINNRCRRIGLRELKDRCVQRG